MRRELILASGSPRRKELLQEYGRDFRIETADVREAGTDEYPYMQVALENACRKARPVSLANPESIVTGADTVIEFERTVIGKPANMEDAKRILRKLSGRTHEVATGVAVFCAANHTEVKFVERSRVKFRQLSEAVIEEYLRKVQVLDKAGAYAVQEHGEMLIESTEGSRSNIVGLPQERLFTVLRMLEQHGYGNPG